jgi:hypothetical protein
MQLPYPGDPHGSDVIRRAPLKNLPVTALLGGQN